MTTSLTQKARDGRLVALRAIQIRKSGSDRVTLFPRADDDAGRIMFSSRRAHTATQSLAAA